MLPKEAILEQAEALTDFIRRGGDGARWFRSKGFSSADKVRIFRASAAAERRRPVRLVEAR